MLVALLMAVWLHVIPLFTEYSSVDPGGQLLIGALIIPPPGLHKGKEQTLLVIVTLFGMILENSGQTQEVGHVPGFVMTPLLAGLV